MRVLAWVLGLVMVLAVCVFGLQILAAETGEVVVLHTDLDGDPAATRLWVVETDGHQWLRAGGGAAQAWYERLLADPHVALERNGVRRNYVAHPEPEMAERVNDLMLEKYGWRDEVVAVLTGAREAAVPVRLIPAGD